VLKTIVQQMQSRPESFLGEVTGLETILSHHDRNLQLACNQQGLIAEIAGQATRVHKQHSASTASVTARKHIELDPSPL
jgi:hypothetical protein